MTATLMSEAELVDLIGGQINRSVERIHAVDKADHLPEVLTEFGYEIAKAVAAAIHTSNQQTLRVAALKNDPPMSNQQYYDHLSACIDGY